MRLHHLCAFVRSQVRVPASLTEDERIVVTVLLGSNDDRDVVRMPFDQTNDFPCGGCIVVAHNDRRSAMEPSGDQTCEVCRIPELNAVTRDSISTLAVINARY